MTKSRNPVEPEVYVPEVIEPEPIPEAVVLPEDPIETPPEDFDYVVGPTNANPEVIDNSPDVYPNEVLGTPTPTEVTDEFANMPDEWKIRNGYLVDTVPVLPTDVPLVKASLREPILSYAKVGLPVLFGGSAAIITKVWDNGLVNLIVFSAEHPVSDIKTKVPYGEGPDTWKEIN